MTGWAHKIEAVAFDMDGLMVNTEELYTEVGDEILRRRGRQFTRELKKAMMGLPGPKAIEVMIQQEKLSDSVEILSIESNQIFVELLPSRLQILPGLEQLLDYLDAKSLPRCVATSSSHQFARSVLEIVNLQGRFDFVVTAEDVEHGKPAPDIYLHAAERMGALPEQMLVLEDSHHGSRAGLASGACTIAVPGEHSRDHDFSGVFYLAQSLDDPGILQAIGGSEN